MNKFDLFKMAVGNLLRRKSRTMLTVLGIVIGTVSIVLMVALGLGMQESVNAQFADQATVNIIEVTKGNNVNTTTRQAESKENDNLQELDLEFLRSIEGVEVVSPSITTNVKLVSGKYEGNFQVMGLDADLLEILGYESDTGRLLTSADDEKVLLFGASSIDSFAEVETSGSGSSGTSQGGREMPNGMAFRGGRPNGGFMGGGQLTSDEEEEDYNVDVFTDRISMTLDTSYSPQSNNTATDSEIIRVQGVGILQEGDMQRDRYVYMELDSLMALIENNNNINDEDTEEGYESAYVKVADMDDVETIQTYIEAYGYTASSSSSFLETMQGTTQTLTIALGAIGAVSMLVAAIGITNTMIMAIHERKKEIGVMKVIGASLNDIKYLFLSEAAMIGFIGGILGISISYGASLLLSSSAFSSAASGNGIGGGNPMSSLTSFNVSMPLWLIGLGMVFTTIIGIISGYFPAKQAMKSSALEAIKTE